MSQKPDVSVQYFTEGGAVFASVEHGLKGIFHLYLSPDSDAEPTWTFRPPNSPEWDSAHQGIYFNSRYDPAGAELIARLPPLPEIPTAAPATWESYFLPAEPIKLAAYPAVAEYLAAQPEQQLRAKVRLGHDVYEASVGDGLYYHFVDAQLNEMAADENCEDHQRVVTIGMNGEEFVFPVFRIKMFEHFTPQDVLKKLEDRLHPADNSPH